MSVSGWVRPDGTSANAVAYQNRVGNRTLMVWEAVMEVQKNVQDGRGLVAHGNGAPVEQVIKAAHDELVSGGRRGPPQSAELLERPRGAAEPARAPVAASEHEGEELAGREALDALAARTLDQAVPLGAFAVPPRQPVCA